MDFSLSEEQEAIRKTFRTFARKEVAPAAASLDAEPRFPRELFLRAGELGLFGMRYPEPDGSGLDVLSHVLAMEEIAWGRLMDGTRIPNSLKSQLSMIWRPWR